MNDIFSTVAPYVPTEAIFNEQADRNSNPAEKKKGLAGIFAANANTDEKRLSFDEKHFEKFLREDDFTNIAKRKRQNPLGDFKFKRINDIF